MGDRVLIVDDDPAICKLLVKVMAANDLEAVVAGSGEQAMVLLEQESFDAILLDINMDGLDGFDVLKRLRGKGIDTPVMIVSGRSEDFDSLYGLSLGADDYVTKPFRPLVLGAKVAALIRRTKNRAAPAVSSCGPFSWDSGAMRFFKGEEELNLSGRERSLLLLFLRHPNQVFTKDTIYESVWGDAGPVDNDTIMVYINRLRSKVETDRQNPKHILTVRGLGYRFVP